MLNVIRSDVCELLFLLFTSFADSFAHNVCHFVLNLNYTITNIYIYTHIYLIYIDFPYVVCYGDIRIKIKSIFFVYHHIVCIYSILYIKLQLYIVTYL